MQPIINSVDKTRNIIVIEEGSSCESCIPDPTAGWGDWHTPDEDDDE